MDDLISRQDAIDALMNSELGSWNNDDYERGARAQHLDDVAAIKSVPSVRKKRKPSAQPEPRWIPVTEGLPKNNGRYLVTRGMNAIGSLWNRVYIINYSDLMGLRKEKIWWTGNVGKSDFVKLEDVLAWMPLPKRYERSEDAES